MFDVQAFQPRLEGVRSKGRPVVAHQRLRQALVCENPPQDLDRLLRRDCLGSFYLRPLAVGVHADEVPVTVERARVQYDPKV